jgi:O-acetyl-ADP-ribose deacetylase (regulator of RNase III)
MDVKQGMPNSPPDLTLGTSKVHLASLFLTRSLNSNFQLGIIHTVGPNLAGRGVEGPTEDDEKQLSSCYKRCLDVALKEGMNSIAFCSISTGLYCYNLDKATAVAFRTVQTWLTENSSIKMKIVFCTFAHPDTNAYEKELGISKYLTNEVNGFNSRK